MENLAEKYGISIGKAALLQYLVSENPNLDYSQLAGFSMEDLVNYLALEGIDISMRISVLPTTHGEKIVMRYLVSATKIDHAGHFGMNE